MGAGEPYFSQLEFPILAPAWPSVPEILFLAGAKPPRPNPDLFLT